MDEEKVMLDAIKPFDQLTREEQEVVLAAVRKIIAPKTVRDVPTPLTPIDTRRYFYIRMNQFECVVDSRDCKSDSKDELLRDVLDNKTQAWYFAGYRSDNDFITVIEEWNHKQYIEWLRRK